MFIVALQFSGRRHQKVLALPDDETGTNIPEDVASLSTQPSRVTLIVQRQVLVALRGAR